MKNLEQLIVICRKLTGNTRYTEGEYGSGISQAVFVQHFNDAQDALVMHINATKNKFFKKTIEVPVVPMQIMYPWPKDIYVRALETVQWVDNRYGSTPITLNKSYTKEKLATRVGYAYSYIPSHDGIEMNPPINYGKLFFTYEKTIPRLQKKSGQIITATMAGDQLTALVVDAAGEMYDEEEINSDYFLCVCDKYGNIKASDVEYESCTGGVFTLQPFTLPAGQTVEVDDFILVGQRQTNVSELPDICEIYLRKYVIYMVRYGDSSSWTKEARDDMASTLAQMDDSFSRMSEDISEIPITNYELL